MDSLLSGIKPAAVGLIVAAAMTIASGVLLASGTTLTKLISNPLGSVSILATAVFVIVAVLNIRFRVNPILLTVLAGLLGAVLAR